jgi:hypothetical protein
MNAQPIDFQGVFEDVCMAYIKSHEAETFATSRNRPAFVGPMI